jgi:hypothetical protein
MQNRQSGKYFICQFAQGKTTEESGINYQNNPHRAPIRAAMLRGEMVRWCTKSSKYYGCVRDHHSHVVVVHTNFITATLRACVVVRCAMVVQGRAHGTHSRLAHRRRAAVTHGWRSRGHTRLSGVPRHRRSMRGNLRLSVVHLRQSSHSSAP